MEFAKRSLQKEKEWTFSDLLDGPLRWALGTNDLALGALSEFFDLAQRQIFVKNIIFKMLDFIAEEVESNG